MPASPTGHCSNRSYPAEIRCAGLSSTAESVDAWVHVATNTTYFRDTTLVCALAELLVRRSMVEKEITGITNHSEEWPCSEPSAKRTNSLNASLAVTTSTATDTS